jgi:anthranilate synthase component 2
MITVIDNYDSFTFNLVQYLGELDSDIHVYRNDQISVSEIDAQQPDFIVISPGPGTPADAGISKDVLRKLGPNYPILGICLGHQCLGEAYGGIIQRAPRLMHGKTSMIHHYNDQIFTGVTNPFEATRYHSLIVEKTGLPDELQIIAVTSEGEIMGLRHKKHLVYGLQFHPESILCEQGKQILSNFISIKEKSI